MGQSEILPEQASRLRKLRELDILDSGSESEFEEIVELASAICGTPICLLSLVDETRQWFKAARGVDVTETSIESSFCAHAIKQTDLFTVEDAAQDARFAQTELVVGAPKIRFYAGMPLSTSDGYVIGTLCVIDTEPRRLTPEQTKSLAVLARQAQSRIEARSLRLALQRSLKQQKEVAASLRTSEALFRAFMNNIPYVTYIKDADGRMLFYNQGFADQLGVTMEECLGKLDHELWTAEQAFEFRKHDLEVLAGGVCVEYNEEITNRGGMLMHFRSTKFPYEDGAGNALLAGVSVDITHEKKRAAELVRYQAELETANDQLRQLSTTDALTGLKNRRAFDDRMSIEYALARRVGRDLSVILIDIDHFKQVNDQYGHAAGDEVLRELSRILEGTVRLADLAVRYGGEEFAVLLPDSSLAQAVRCAERFRGALQSGRFAHGALTVSMGVAGIADGRSGEQVMARADEALYAAKRGGRDAVVVYHPLLNDVSIAAEEACIGASKELNGSARRGIDALT